MKATVYRFYRGHDNAAITFQWSLLTFDVATIGYFITTAFSENEPWMTALDATLGVLLLADWLARLWITPKPERRLSDPVAIADLIVIVSLFAGLILQDQTLLRILRAFRLVRAYHALTVLRRRWPAVREQEEVARAVLNLAVFVFVVTATVFVTQREINPGISTYVDALYFTITTLTTTGFGDITMVGDYGRLLSVLIMICGISLFLRLVQTVFRPRRVHAPCEECGLTRHDLDAVHCKHCGAIVNIPNDGTP